MPMVTCHKVVRTVQKQRDKRKKEREKHLFDVCFIEGETIFTMSVLLKGRPPLRRLFH